MRRTMLAAVLVAAPLFALGSTPAEAYGCRGYGYYGYAPYYNYRPYYGYSYAPYYRPRDYYGSNFYRPWGGGYGYGRWGGYGYRGWGRGGRGWGGGWRRW